MDIGFDENTRETVLHFKAKCTSCGKRQYVFTNILNYLSAENGDLVDAKCPVCGANHNKEE